MGAALVIPKFSFENNIFQGFIWGVFSAMAFAFLSVLNKKYIRTYSSLLIAFYQDLAATILLLPFLFVYQTQFTQSDVLLLILLGTILTAASHSLFINGMKHIKAQTASIIASVEPVYGIMFALFLFAEIPSIRTVFGGVVILGAATYSSLSKES